MCSLKFIISIHCIYSSIQYEKMKYSDSLGCENHSSCKLHWTLFDHNICICESIINEVYRTSRRREGYVFTGFKFFYYKYNLTEEKCRSLNVQIIQISPHWLGINYLLVWRIFTNRRHLHFVVCFLKRSTRIDWFIGF